MSASARVMFTIESVRQSCRSLCCCSEERQQNSLARSGGDVKGGDVHTVFGAYGLRKGTELSSFLLESNAKGADIFLLAL